MFPGVTEHTSLLSSFNRNKITAEMKTDRRPIYTGHFKCLSLPWQHTDSLHHHFDTFIYAKRLFVVFTSLFCYCSNFLLSFRVCLSPRGHFNHLVAFFLCLCSQCHALCYRSLYLCSPFMHLCSSVVSL